MENLSDNVLHMIGQFIYDPHKITHYHTSPIHYYFSTLALLNKTMLHRAYDEYFWKNQPFPIVLRNKLIFEETEKSDEMASEEVEDAKTNALLQLEALMNVCRFAHLRIESYMYRKFTSDLLRKIAVSLPSVLVHLELNCASLNRGVLLDCLESLQEVKSVVLSLKMLTAENPRRTKLILTRKHWETFEIRYRSSNPHSVMEQFVFCCLTANPDLVSLRLDSVPVNDDVASVIKSLSRLGTLELLDQIPVNKSTTIFENILDNCTNLKVLGFTTVYQSDTFPDITEKQSNLEELTYGTVYWGSKEIPTMQNLRRATLICVSLASAKSLFSPVLTYLKVQYREVDDISLWMRTIADSCPNLVSLLFETQHFAKQFITDDIQYTLMHLTQLRELSLTHIILKDLLNCIAQNAPSTLSDLTIGNLYSTDTYGLEACQPLPTIRTLRVLIPYSVDPLLLELFPNLVKLELGYTRSSLHQLFSAKSNKIRELVIPLGSNIQNLTGITGTLPKLQAIEFTSAGYFHEYNFEYRMNLMMVLMVAVPNLHECNLLSVFCKTRSAIALFLEESISSFREEHEEEECQSYDAFFSYVIHRSLSKLQGEYETSHVTTVVDQLTTHRYAETGDVNPATLLLPGFYRLLEPVYHEICQVLDTDFSIFSSE